MFPVGYKDVWRNACDCEMDVCLSSQLSPSVGFISQCSDMKMAQTFNHSLNYAEACLLYLQPISSHHQPNLHAFLAQVGNNNNKTGSLDHWAEDCMCSFWLKLFCICFLNMECLFRKITHAWCLFILVTCAWYSTNRISDSAKACHISKLFP